MIKQYEIKNMTGGIVDVDDKSRRVKTVWNKTGIKDEDKDIMESTCFDKTIRERGPKSKNLIWHLTDHRPSLKDAVGKPSDLYVENNQLTAITDIASTTWGNDVLQLYKSGVINQHSIGFSTIKREVFNADDWTTRYSVIKEVKLFEGSAVMWGANAETPTISVGKSLTKEEVAEEYLKTLEEVNTLAKLFKTGHLSDQSFELLEIKMNQLTDKLKQLFEKATLPADQAVEPTKGSLLEVFTTFNNSLTLQNESHRIASSA